MYKYKYYLNMNGPPCCRNYSFLACHLLSLSLSLDVLFGAICGNYVIATMRLREEAVYVMLLDA